MDRRNLFRSLANDVVAGWVVLGSAALLLALLGDALTGGVRLEARAQPEVVSPWIAACLFLWVAAAGWTGLRVLRGQQ